jgi:hypothetical protein
MARAFVTVPALAILAVVAGWAATPVSGQTAPAPMQVQADGDLQNLRSQLERRFEILPLANGVLLRPRVSGAVRSIEVTDVIAVDGSPVTGGELRQRLGPDTDVVLKLSYLDVASRRSLAGVVAGAPPATTLPPAASPAPEIAPRVQRTNRREAIVRIGGSVTVARDEMVDDDVVVIGGSANIDGQVDGDVVVVGGSAVLGPNADIRNDLTVVGGTLSRDPSATIGGRVQEVGIAGIPFGEWSGRRAWSGWNPVDGFRPVVRFMGTVSRVALLMLLAGLVMFVARAPVEQIAERAAAEPVKSWVVGFLAEILFVPMLVITTVVLAISIIGIPLLLLIPIAVVAAMVLFLVGFTGVAYYIGRLLRERIEPLRSKPYAATFAGIVLILSPLLLARVVGLASPGQLGIFVGILVAIGVVVEYLAWTTGLGAAALARFGRPLAPEPHVLPPASPTGM